jgi:glycine/D-amino acid oxidase-like deaminating enzyme/nitrite reductase/ring-hydroxylating ferredoxin subunit
MKENKINPQETSGRNKSYWLDSAKQPLFESLQSNEKCDVVIIGGGIAGLSVAYTLVKEGKKVILLEDGNIASGESGRTSAHLASSLDDKYYIIRKDFGEEDTKLAAQSHMAAIDYIEKIIAEESIVCEFKRLNGYMFLHPTDKIESINKEFEAASKAGLSVKLVDEVPGLKNVNGPAIKFHNQARFHPVKYLNGLADAIRKRGGKIYTNTHVSEFNDKEVMTASGFKVQADHIVVATNSPVNNKYAIHLKQFPFRTYVMAVRVKKNSVPDALYWDTGNFDEDPEMPPYHYVRLISSNDDYDLVLAGGEDHATGLADAQKIPEENRYEKLEKWLKDKIEFESIEYKWSGQVLEPADCLAYIGRNPYDSDNVYIVTGDSGNGLTHGTIAGILIPDLINNRKNPWEDIYSPSRYKIASIKTWIKEFGGGFIDYLKNNPDKPDEVFLNSITKGDAKIVQFDKEKFGVYRDAEDKLHFVSAECTHLKCTIKWNGDEKSWDCPCHGSRFTYEGKVINGPANVDLLYWATDEGGERIKDKGQRING